MRKKSFHNIFACTWKVIEAINFQEIFVRDSYGGVLKNKLWMGQKKSNNFFMENFVTLNNLLVRP